MADNKEIDLSGLHFSDVTPKDQQIVAEQLGRLPRSMVAIGHRCTCGSPQVVVTLPRLDDGSPFPTNFYLTDPLLVRVISNLEANGEMKKLQDQLEASEEIQEKYLAAHRHYLAARALIAYHQGMSDVPEIENISAGGMPTRVKCLHALVGHALAAGPLVNPIGDLVLEKLVAEKTVTKECFHQ